ncbi:hypothetical protein GCM10020000_77530 [Streptomyces olivoverticillatus]
MAARGPRLSLLLAGLAMTASGVMFAAFDAGSSSDALLMAAYVVFGIGFGLVNAPHHQHRRLRHAPLPRRGRRGRRQHQPSRSAVPWASP